MIPREPGGPVQVVARGLLGFLQLKSMGQNPAAIPDTIQCTLELRDWLFFTNSVLDTVTRSYAWVAADGFSYFQYATPLVVPNNEYWFVSDYVITLPPLAAGRFVGWAAYRDPVVPATRTVGPLVDHPPAAIANGLTHSTARDFWVAPGTTFGFLVGGATGVAAQTINGYLRYTPLPI